jgi:hypothetical protein
MLVTGEASIKGALQRARATYRLEGDAVAAITWFDDTAIFRHFGLPPTLPSVST